MAEDGGELASVVENCVRTSSNIDGHMDCDSSGVYEVRHRSGAGIRKLGKSWAENTQPDGYGAVVNADGTITLAAAPEVVAAAGDCEDGADASLHKFWHRAGWLVLLLMCQSTSSVILEHFEVLIKSHPVVIYFLTMLVGAGGNAGGQSTVLVVRRLALAAVGGRGGHAAGDAGLSMRRIVGSELSVGAQLSVVLCCASFVRCVAFQVRGVECLAICLSMLVIVFTSTLVGAALPLLLRRLNVDPAHAGATIQVVMDISGVTLTCVVSCLVLGLPLSGKPRAVGAGAAEAASGAGAGIQQERSHGLARFGTDVGDALR
mmetsp:Transcript_43734/g.136796  ORF Transcript_43734/g.136796 Transcript_43734/m.136796 type:complete len:318 (-) Transcript_43734:174-1127(-)